MELFTSKRQPGSKHWDFHFKAPKATASLRNSTWNVKFKPLLKKSYALSCPPKIKCKKHLEAEETWETVQMTD